MWKLRDIDASKSKTIRDHFGFASAIADILVGRSLDTPEKVKQFTHISFDNLGSPLLMHGMVSACDRLWEAIRAQHKIMIHGDFDADGITSSALLTLFLRDVGAKVETFIPNRLEEGHGLSQKFIHLAVEKKINLVITCDCGSSNEKEINALKKSGIDTIVTDHHYIAHAIPNAIVVNPKHAHENEQPEELSGVGVVFMLLMGLRKKLRDEKYFENRVEPNLKKYLDIVALGTIADMAPLIGQNRILVIKGLEELQKTTRPGLMAMKEKVGLTSGQLNSFDIGFKLAPRLNAAARLGFAMEAFEIMVSDHPLTAQDLSTKMETWNSQRKKIQNKMVEQCQKELLRQIDDHEVLVFASPDFHPGLIGLAAQKICSDTGKPSFVFRIEGEVAKGSARCRPPFRLLEMLDSVQDLIGEYGGHTEAGGCKMPTKNLQEFTRRIQVAARQQKGTAYINEKWLDASVDLDEVNEQLLVQLYSIGPFGIGNPEPMFSAQGLVVGTPKEVGQNHLQANIRSPLGRNYACIAFGKWGAWNKTFCGHVSVHFTVQENIWQGKSSISLQIQDFSPMTPRG